MSAGALPQWSHLGLETIAVLGQGGMGVVYRVRDHRLQRDAALKLIKTGSGGADARAVNRFRREVLVTAQLDHPGIPPVYDSGVDPQGQPYMLMRVVEGRPLSQIIAEHHEDYGGELTQRELVEVVVRVAEAVAYAHTQGIVHRDLKPANVMVGRFGEVLVMDWGLARELRTSDAEDAALRDQVATSAAEEAAQAGLTLQGAVVGTPGYMPPEQAGGSAVDERADVFALGALLCVVLTGRPPVEGHTSINRLAATISGKIARPRDHDRGVPAELDAIAAAALAVEPERRTSTAAAFVDDLRAYLAGEEVSAYRYSISERLLRRLRRHVALLTVGSLFVVSLTGVGLAWVSSEAAKREAEREAKREADVATAQTLERERLQKALELLAQADRAAQRGGRAERVTTLVQEALSGVRTRYTLNHAARIFQDAGLTGQAVAMLEEAAERFSPAFAEVFALHLLWLEAHPQTSVEGTSSPPMKRLKAMVEASEEENEFTRYLAAQTHEQAGEVQEALRVYGELLAEFPRFTWALTNCAKIHLELNEPRKALRWAERAVASSPRFGAAIATRGAAYAALGKFDAAMTDLSTAIQLQPNMARAYVMRAGLWVRRNTGKQVSEGDRAILMADVRKAASLAPRDPMVLLLQAVAAMLGQDFAGAVRFCDEAIKHGAGWQGYEKRGLAHYQTQNIAAALRDFEQALELAPPASKARLRRSIQGLKGQR